jgi:hypothetical protein
LSIACSALGLALTNRAAHALFRAISRTPGTSARNRVELTKAEFNASLS